MDVNIRMLQQTHYTKPLDTVTTRQSEFLSLKAMDVRKELGQFFTSSVVSDYMALLINEPVNKSVRLLDAGAGTGILTVSTSLRCLELGCEKVHAVLYELDAAAVPYLEESLAIVQDIFTQRGKSFTFEIRCTDFVLSRPDRDNNVEKFDLSIINPPYFKYSAKSSSYAGAAADLYKGDPNIYASFMAVVLACLKKDGQLISITPRSFTNGLYFKGFRTYLLNNSSLNLLHIFKHRDKVFKNQEAQVLQENIICHFTKSTQKADVLVRASDCHVGITEADENEYPIDLIIDPSNDQKIIRIPESSEEADILRRAENLPNTFEGAGYFISTGRVVEHRTWGFITAEVNAPNSIPLYRPHNIKPLKASWTGQHKKDVSFIVNDGHEKHTMKNGTYVLLKRFSSKDEKRRLVSGVHFKRDHNCEFIGFGNKTNYIGVRDKELTSPEAYGLAAVFNSTFMDKYFRCISGNTQVNATEIRVMKFPSREQICAIGKEVQKQDANSTLELDRIVNRVLGVSELVCEELK